MTKLEELEIELRGRVQGILFRVMTKRYCVKHNIRGIVANLPDGGVKIIAQGEKVELENLLGWLQKNPGISKVEGMDFSWRKIIEEFKDFRVILNGSFLKDKGKSLISLGKEIFGKGLSLVPKHVAVIPDGNRRWAREKGLIASAGHYRAGNMAHVLELFGAAKSLGVKYFSIWGFSSENWARSKGEKEALFNLLTKGVKKFEEVAKKEGIYFRHIGRKDRLPKKLILALQELENRTKNNREFFVQLCLDYGGRDEIVRAVNKIIKSKKKKIDEKEFEEFLDSKEIPNPDLVIRTSGEMRTSGFMPYQAAYSELYFCEKYFPDFGAKELKQAVKEYGRRARRFGR